MPRKVNWAGEGVNPFDAVATPVKATKGKTTKLVAVVDDEIRAAVERYISKKATLAAIKAEVEQLDTQIIEHVREQQDRLARQGNFSKSFEVHGVEEKSVITYTTSDKFSTPKEPEAQGQLKALLGEQRFNELFTQRRSISLKVAVQTDLKFLQKFAKALADAGIGLGETFDVVDVLEAKPDLDRNQYDLTPREHEVFRTLVRQNKPALK